MIPPDMFWERVHAALDDRIDPIDDPAVREAVAADNELRDELASLCLALDDISAPPSVTGAARPISRTRTRVGRAAAAAAAVLVLALPALLLAWPTPEPARDASPSPRVGEPSGAVHWFRVRVTHASPDGTVSAERRSGNRTNRAVDRVVTSGPPSETPPSAIRYSNISYSNIRYRVKVTLQGAAP